MKASAHVLSAPTAGNLSRPTVADIYKYREYVDEAMDKFLLR